MQYKVCYINYKFLQRKIQTSVVLKFYKVSIKNKDCQLLILSINTFVFCMKTFFMFCFLCNFDGGSWLPFFVIENCKSYQTFLNIDTYKYHICQCQKPFFSYKSYLGNRKELNPFTIQSWHYHLCLLMSQCTLFQLFSV